MSITLPVRSSGGARRQAGIAIPDAGDVPHVQEGRDPGVTIPQAAFDNGGAAMQQAGAELQQVAVRIKSANDAAQARRDVVLNPLAENTFNQAADAEKLRLMTGGTPDDPVDVADPLTIAHFGGHLNDTTQSILANYQGSEAGRETLQARLGALRGNVAREVGIEHVKAGMKKVETLIGSDINAYTAAVSADPTTLPAKMLEFNQRLDHFAPALAPESAVALQSSAYRQMTLAGVHHYLDIGDDVTAREFLNHAPNATKLLKPEDQAQLNQAFATAEMNRTKGTREAQQKLALFRGINGRDPTATERLDLSGVSAGNPQSPVGKALADIENFKARFGANSPQVAALQAGLAKETGATNSEESTLRSQYMDVSRPFVATQQTFSRIAAAAENPSAMGDLALIYGYARLLSPQGAVTDADYANLAASGSLGAQIQGMVQRASSGQRLTPDQRADVLQQSKSMFTTQLEGQLSLERQYKSIAKRSGYAEDNVLDVIGPYRNIAMQPQKGPNVGEVVNGFRFKGGNPAAEGSWEPVEATKQPEGTI